MSTATEQLLFTIFKAARDAALEFFEPIFKLIELRRNPSDARARDDKSIVFTAQLPSTLQPRSLDIATNLGVPSNHFIGLDQQVNDKKFTDKRASALLRIAIEYDDQLKNSDLYSDQISIVSYILLADKIANKAQPAFDLKSLSEFTQWFKIPANFLHAEESTVDESTLIVLTLPEKPASVRAVAFSAVALILHSKGKYAEAAAVAEYSQKLYSAIDDQLGTYRASIQMVASLLFAGQLDKGSIAFESLLNVYSETV
jgi:hypothetical protein